MTFYCTGREVTTIAANAAKDVANTFSYKPDTIEEERTLRKASKFAKATTEGSMEGVVSTMGRPNHFLMGKKTTFWQWLFP